MAELESLTKKRQTTRASVTRIKNIISSAMSFAELECRLSLVEAYFKQLLSIQSDIEELNPNDVGRADIEDLCIRTKSKIIQLLGDNFKRPSADMSMAIPGQTSSKLPTLELPTFDGKYTDYKNFISSFKQFVDTDSSLQAIEKFNHLLHCLRGPALDTVRAFQVTSENYEKALKQLEDRYDNTTLIFLKYIQHLYDLPIVPKPSCVQLRSLVDSASAIYSSLKSLGTVEDICNAFIIQLISQKTDRDTQIKWREHMDYSQLPSWDKFCKHLERRCQFLESSESHSTQTFSRQNNNNFQHRNMYQNRSSFHAQQKSCLLCKNSEHWLSGCNNFKAMNTSKNRCKICSKSHHTLLHRPVSASQSVNTTVNTSLAATSTSVQHQQLSTASVNAHLDSKSGGVILATAVILVTDHNGEFQLCRALLDSCSQVNLITESFSRVLNLGRKKCAVNIVGVGNSSTNIKYETYATVRSRYTTEDFPLRFFITKRVSGYQPEMDLDISNWNLPSDIKLADVDFNKSQVIDMLIGADAFFDILGKHKVKLNSNLPILQETSFGYVVSGRYTTEKNCQDSYTYSYTADLSTREEDENLNKQLEVLWNMEKVASSSVPKSEYEACEAHFLQHVEFSPENRIQVKLPFLEDPPLLGTSHSSALRRFCQLEKSLVRNEEVREQYITFMREYESLGHMTLVNPDLNKPHYYIPHKFVLKPNSTATKLRVVFDASSKTSSMDSLNDKLLTGPTIQDDLFSLLIQFRLWKYALSGDIEKMYRMVLVHPNHRPFQLILWRESDRQPISTYQLNTITYGMSASPFLAIRAMHFLADKYKREYQIGSEIVKTKFYVDDMLTGANDLETLLKIKYETTALLSKGGFNLTKFRSNCTLAQAETTENKNINETSDSNALGIIWNPTLDIFKFAFNPKKLYSEITKRAILSLVSSIFDPIGLVCPIVIIPRVLLQDLWIAKIDWDKTVPQKSKELFTNFLQDLENLSLLKIPRYILQPNSFSLQLHGFSDASIRAYGCCMYIRSTDKNGNIVTN